MSDEIRTTAQIGKSLSIKRVTVEEDEVVVAQLSFSDAAVKRDEADEVLGVAIGWTERLFDELGAPAFKGALDLHGRPLPVSAVVGLTKGHKLKIANGELGKIALEFEPNGFLLSGTFTWQVAGDESADVEDLLGKLCNLTLTVERRQQDLLGKAA
jgi:hypothetical protein